MAGRQSELDRLQLQARVWEPAGERLLAGIGAGSGLRVLDAGCGALGWLRVLARWVGEEGSVVGTDIQPSMLDAARGFVASEGLANVEVIEDDLFASDLPAASFDLVHARFQIAPLGKAEEQVAAYERLLRPGGILVLEEPDTASWHHSPPAPAAEALIGLILRAFLASGGDFDAGRRLHDHLGAGSRLGAEVVALEPGHPYLQLPLQFAASLEPRLLELVSAGELGRLREEAEVELTDPARWGLTFTLVQAWKTL
jgi:SAM-dependent methyltransferase